MRGIANTETTSLVDKGDFILFLGVPVICFGLKNATQLNGKIGYIRAFDEDRFATTQLCGAGILSGEVR